MVPMILVLLAPAVVLARQIPLTGRPVVTGAEVWRDGAWVVLRVDGEDEQAAADAAESLFTRHFDEDS